MQAIFIYSLTCIDKYTADNSCCCCECVFSLFDCWITLALRSKQKQIVRILSEKFIFFPWFWLPVANNYCYSTSLKWIHLHRFNIWFECIKLCNSKSCAKRCETSIFEIISTIITVGNYLLNLFCLLLIKSFDNDPTLSIQWTMYNGW